MKKAVLLSMVLAVMLLPTDLLANDRLTFAMAGSRNGAMPDFYIAAGRVSETTRDTIYVTSTTYKSITSLISSIGSYTTLTKEQFFSVTEFRNSVPSAALFIADKAVGDIMRRIILTYESEGQAVPKLVPEIADSLP